MLFFMVTLVPFPGSDSTLTSSIKASITEKPMPENAVVSAEPGIYLPGKFGVRIEDVMVLRPDGAEIITKVPKALLVL